MKLYPAFPTNPLAAIFPFIVVVLINMAALQAGMFPNVIIFYASVGVALILASGLIGWERLWEYYGFALDYW